jgi:hypothetical protein
MVLALNVAGCGLKRLGHSGLVENSWNLPVCATLRPQQSRQGCHFHNELEVAKNITKVETFPTINDAKRP